MNSPDSETGPLTFKFLSVATEYFSNTDRVPTGIGPLLSRLLSVSGATFISVQKFVERPAKDHSLFKVISHCSALNDGSEVLPFVPGSDAAGLKLLERFREGNPVLLNNNELKEYLENMPGERVISGFAGFPVKVDGVFWGIISMEFSDTVKQLSDTGILILQAFAGMMGEAFEEKKKGQDYDQSDLFYEKLFDDTPVAIAILDQDGYVEKINREFTKLFQYESAEIVGCRIDDVLPSDIDKDGASLLTNRVLDGERISHVGVRYRKDGTAVYVSIFGVQSLPSSNNPKVYSIYYDTTDKILAEEKLRESMVRFELLFESANDAILLMKDGLVVDCNARTLEIFRCMRDDIIGKSTDDLSPKKQADGSPSLSQAIKNNKILSKDSEKHSFEWLHQRPDGSQFAAEVSLSFFEWNSESYAQAIVRDISNRKRTEKLLSQRFDFIAFLSRVSADLINLDSSKFETLITEVLAYSGTFAAFDQAFIYLLNKEGVRLHLSYKWASNTSKMVNVEDQIRISYLPAIYKNLTNNEVIIREVKLSPSDAEEALLSEIFDLEKFHSYLIIPLSVYGKCIGFTIYLAGQEIPALINESIQPLKLTSQMIANAIERGRIEEELKSAKEKAVESDKLKTAFLSSMSHEIRTPMNHILGFIELLKDPGLSDREKKEFMAIIKSSGNVLLRLIDDIIDIAKLESNQLDINIVDLDLNKFCNDLYLAFKEQLKSTGKDKIEFRVRKPERVMADTIKTDPLRLHQVVSNLLSNAMKFTQEGSITFGYTLEPDNFIHFYVEDTGIGIPPEKYEEVFERFRQLDGSYAREYGGTGLGLAISKGLVELLKGEIGVESKPGIGSRFFFTIPYQPAYQHPAGHVAKPVSSKEYDFSGKTILIVEDDEINYRFLEIVMLKTKARVLRAFTGSEAIELALREDVSIVLMDIQIPVVDGYAATIAIKKVKPDLPVIAQTAHALAEEKTRCLESGADDYLSKPINRRDLLSKMLFFLKADKASKS